VQAYGKPLPALLVRCGELPYTVLPDDGPITIGRDLPAQIRINDPRISRTHARIEARAEHWTVEDTGSTNGIYLDGVRVDTISVTGDVTIRLGNPEGIPVVLSLISALGAESESDGEVTAVNLDVDVARAGLAVADRREELGFSARMLDDAGVVTARVLSAFEHGQTWPDEETRARIEHRLEWPPGTLDRIRAGGAPPEDESTEIISDTVEHAVFVDAMDIALHRITGRVDGLPAVDDSTFDDQAADLLHDLHTLESTVASAARTSRSPDVAVLLSDVRRTYHRLLLRAADSPGATLAQRLQAARHRAELSVEETANATGLSVEVITDAEAGRPVPEEATAALDALVARLHR
jgi:transcriptional regulator with XRE-family HTH domain